LVRFPCRCRPLPPPRAIRPLRIRPCRAAHKRSPSEFFPRSDSLGRSCRRDRIQADRWIVRCVASRCVRANANDELVSPCRPCLLVWAAALLLLRLVDDDDDDCGAGPPLFPGCSRGFCVGCPAALRYAMLHPGLFVRPRRSPPLEQTRPWISSHRIASHCITSHGMHPQPRACVPGISSGRPTVTVTRFGDKDGLDWIRLDWIGFGVVSLNLVLVDFNSWLGIASLPLSLSLPVIRDCCRCQCLHSQQNWSVFLLLEGPPFWIGLSFSSFVVGSSFFRSEHRGPQRRAGSRPDQCS